MTKTEKGYPPDVEFVSTPHALKDEGKSSRWTNSEYLHERKGELAQVISELQHHYPPVSLNFNHILHCTSFLSPSPLLSFF